MAAVTGYLIQELCRFPGAIDLDGTTFASIPNGFGAIGAVPLLGWVQIIGSIGYWELVGWEQEEGAEPGTFGTGYFGRSLEGDEKREKLTIDTLYHRQPAGLSSRHLRRTASST